MGLVAGALPFWRATSMSDRGLEGSGTGLEKYGEVVLSSAEPCLDRKKDEESLVWYSCGFWSCGFKPASVLVIVGLCKVVASLLRPPILMWCRSGGVNLARRAWSCVKRTLGLCGPCLRTRRMHYG